jgi:hypothetical protein
VENNSTAEFFSRILNPCGPIITPEMISPIIPGIFSRFSRMGDNRIIKRIREKTNTGLVRGSSMLPAILSKSSFILPYRQYKDKTILLNF